MFLDRLFRKQSKPSFDPDRYEIKVKRNGEWVTVWQDGDMPKEPEDIPDAIYEPGQRYAIWDRNDKRWLGTIKTPGKKKDRDRDSEGSEREKRDPLDKAIHELDKMGDSLLKVGTAFQKVQEGISKAQLGGITKEDLENAFINALQKTGLNQQRDFRSEVKQVKEFLDDWRGVGLALGLIKGSDSDIPPEIAAKLPSWSLPFYFPPSRGIKELKDAGKEIVEHAIKTAKGEITGEEQSLASEAEGEVSFLEKYRRKMQTKGG
jgi:hypothetical protein